MNGEQFSMVGAEFLSGAIRIRLEIKAVGCSCGMVKGNPVGIFELWKCES
jgi:hypothetical protein